MIVRGVLIMLIRLYQRWIPAHYRGACRYTPSCSAYACQAVERHGPLSGLLLATRRVLRCHPLGSSGYDPVP
ncbi:MAG: membrane protein insertion efficiency factor YidD [Candidatus Eiseniibacteriota bacterium]